MAEDVIVSGDNSEITVSGDYDSDSDKLQKALISVQSSFFTRAKSVQQTMYVFLIISVSLSVVASVYYCKVFSGDWKPNFKGAILEVWYDIILRIIMMCIIMSVIIYCIRMMAKYLLLLGDIRHKISVISSMPSLLKSSDDKELFKKLYEKIVEMLINAAENKSETIEIIKPDGLIEIIKNLTGKK